MSHRVPPQCAEEACALSDFTQLSMTDLNEAAWVTQSSGEAYSRNPTSWDSEQHVLLPAQLTSSDEVTRMNAQRAWNRNLRTIGTRTFLSTPTLSVTAFVLPAGTQLDLHDHPGMTVLQALVVGNLSALSLDWADSSLTQKEAPTREGVVVHSGILNEGDRHVIRPSEGGVLHHLSSLHDQQQSSSSNSNDRGGSSGITVFVDFITPPYFAPPACSLCTYYKLSATKGGEAMAPRSYTSSLTKGDKVWLTPDHTYDGPDMVPLIPVG
ncbi:Hypothetical protein, putative [Bodo saltans]|uniref:Cysteine dioxygenase n=1 Tax=Bodo saltans TaxID=75058 RepID=A0A0S4IQ52_BODSA|nr:Hypothetical protein, putative [Bodo saltans]|eukprot:CUF18718.1 Hypothetical protein, putative [Bodo saltans]